jgi:hypothetical protein
METTIKACAAGYEAFVNADGRVSIHRTVLGMGTFAGRGTWNGRTIENCDAQLGAEPEDTSVYDALEAAILAELRGRKMFSVGTDGGQLDCFAADEDEAARLFDKTCGSASALESKIVALGGGLRIVEDGWRVTRSVRL